MSAPQDPTGPPAVVLQHRDDAPGGLLIDVLVERGFQPRIVRLDLGEALPAPNAFSLAVTLGRPGLAGGSQPGSASDELDWLRAADRAGTAILGLGAGAQSLSVALGGAVDRARRSRHGWVWVSSATPKWVSTGPWLAWSDEVIRLPSEAKLLAHDAVGPQVFSVGRHLGVQFHPEVTPEIVGGWVTADRGEALDTQGILEVTSREFARASAAAHRLLATYLHTLT